jgi:hypothetical protein
MQKLRRLVNSYLLASSKRTGSGRFFYACSLWLATKNPADWRGFSLAFLVGLIALVTLVALAALQLIQRCSHLNHGFLAIAVNHQRVIHCEQRIGQTGKTWAQ